MYPTKVINQNNKFNPKNNVDGDFTNTNTTNNIGFSYGKKCVINKRAMGNDRSISNTKFTTTFLKANHLVKSDVLFPTQNSYDNRTSINLNTIIIQILKSSTNRRNTKVNTTFTSDKDKYTKLLETHFQDPSLEIPYIVILLY